MDVLYYLNDTRSVPTPALKLSDYTAYFRLT